ncbi:unnamed protein product, partial [Staurois parvus]
MTDPRSRRTNHKAQVLLAHAHWAPGCHAERHYRSREDSARLDRGTAVICAVRSLWSSPVLSAVSGHLLYCPCSLWSSPVLSAVSGHLLYYCLQ